MNNATIEPPKVQVKSEETQEEEEEPLIFPNQDDESSHSFESPEFTLKKQPLTH